MVENIRLAVCVFIGSGLGGMCRFLLSMCINRRVEALFPSTMLGAFPLATLVVNVLGCFLIGLIYGYAGQHVVSPAMKTFLAAGFCGGLTTFSTFSHENFVLFGSGHWHVLAAYVLVSLVVGFLAARFGHTIALG